MGRREMSAFFFLRLPVLKFASIRTKPSLGVKEDQRMFTVNGLLSRDDIGIPEVSSSRIQGLSLAPKVAASHADLRKS